MLHLCDVPFSIAFSDAVAMRKNVNFSDRISIEKVVPENVDRKRDFFDSIPGTKDHFAQDRKIVFFDSIRNDLTVALLLLLSSH